MKGGGCSEKDERHSCYRFASCAYERAGSWRRGARASLVASVKGAYEGPSPRDTERPTPHTYRRILGKMRVM